jgi:hypothetical protein
MIWWIITATFLAVGGLALVGIWLSVKHRKAARELARETERRKQLRKEELGRLVIGEQTRDIFTPVLPVAPAAFETRYKRDRQREAAFVPTEPAAKEDDGMSTFEAFNAFNAAIETATTDLSPSVDTTPTADAGGFGGTDGTNFDGGGSGGSY